MTLPLLLAQVSLTEDTALSVRLAWMLGGAIVLGVWWAGREFQRGVERDKAINAIQVQQAADALRITALELNHARTDERLDRLFEVVARVEMKLDRLFEQKHETRRSA